MQKLRVFFLLLFLLLLAPPAKSAALADDFAKANSAETHGRTKEAIALYNKIIDASNKDKDAAWAARSRARIARLLVIQGNLKEAEPLYLQTLKVSPALFKQDLELMVDIDDFAESYNALACKSTDAKSTDAKECLFHVLALRLAVDPHHPNVTQSYRHIALYMINHGDRAAAERYIKQGIELEKNYPPDKLYRFIQDKGLLASIYMHGSEWVKAEQTTRDLLQQIEKYPFLSWAWPQLHCTLGKCHSEQFQYEDSDREYQLAIALAKKYPNPNGDISPECVKGLKENAILKVKNRAKAKKVNTQKH